MVTRPSNGNADAVEEGSDHKKKQEPPDFLSILHGTRPRNRDMLPLTSVKHQTRSRKHSGRIGGNPSLINH
jgi:hypothetical protein